MAHPGGRPLKFKSPEDLEKKIEAYKEHVKTTKEPATITGLAVFLDTSRETLSEYSERPEFVDPLKKAKDWVQAEYERRALSNQSNPVFTIFSLKNNFGWRDKSEQEHTGKDGGPIEMTYKRAEIAPTKEDNSHEDTLRVLGMPDDVPQD